MEAEILQELLKALLSSGSMPEIGILVTLSILGYKVAAAHWKRQAKERQDQAIKFDKIIHIGGEVRKDIKELKKENAGLKQSLLETKDTLAQMNTRLAVNESHLTHLKTQS